MGRLGVVLDYSQLSDKIYHVLRDKIIRLQFGSGERLDVMGLAEELNVSSTSVKVAVNRLALEGLLEVLPRYGTFVSSISAKDVADITAARLMIELFAVETGLHAVAQSDLEHMIEINSGMERIRASEAPSDADVERYFALNSEFHASLVHLARNRRIDDMYAALNILIKWTWAYYSKVPFDPSPSLSDHTPILEACARRNVAAAREALRQQIETAGRKAVDALTKTQAATNEQHENRRRRWTRGR